MTPQSQLIFDKSDLVRSRTKKMQESLSHVKTKKFRSNTHQLILELGSETRSYPSIIFIFFSVLLSFSVFASIFLFFVSTSSKKKQKRVIFHLVTVSNHISILKRKKNKERERERD
jgi:hypothetical protein